MKKILLLLLISLIFTGCSKDKKIEQLEQISERIVSLYSSPKYDKKGLEKWQLDMINKYYDKLNHIGEVIDLEPYIIYQDEYKTNEPDSKGVYIENNKCYIKYEDINITSDTTNLFEGEALLVCNGYYFTLLASNLGPNYEDIVDSKNTYNYLGYTLNNGYQFYYRSYYDGSGLIVKVDEEVTTKFESVDNIEFEKENISINTTFIWIIAVGGVGLGIVFLLKKYRDNNNL